MDGTMTETERDSLKTVPPVLAVRHGRGRTGGSTLCDFLIQRARRAGRSVLIGDGDRRNATLAGFYPPGSPGGASQPPTDETPDVKDWITALLGEMVGHQASLVLDLGGGDRVLAEFGRELALTEFCDSVGVNALALYMIGPDMDDFDHVLAIHRSGQFTPKRSVVVMNENLVRAGKTPAGAFDPIIARPEFVELGNAGAATILMPRLAAMNEVRAAGLSFYDAAEGRRGRSGRPIDPVRQFMVKTWIARMEEEFRDNQVVEWLP